VRTRTRQDPVERQHTTLRKYYEKKRALYGNQRPEFLDRDLRRLFSYYGAHGTNEAAGHYLRRHRSELTAIVSRWTSEYRYRIDQALREMIKRCDELELHITRDDEAMKLEVTAFVMRLVMDYLHTGRFLVRV
jgi:hypothetical protein